MKNGILEYLKDHVELASSMARDVNSYDGSLDYLEYWENDDYFFEIFYPNKTIEAVRAVCYGSYNYMDDYVRINEYGNLDSCSEFEYLHLIEDNIEEILDRFIELYKDNNIDIYDNEAKEKINEYLESIDKNKH